ncbi:MAG: ester cyclase [Rubrivivax sp.]|nr:MAG: ester cyclase [Rubrivivax sp.]
MSHANIEATYQAYIDCINDQDWGRLGDFVHDDVRHNGKLLGVAGYRAMLENDYEKIPDLRFCVQMLVADPTRIACRLQFRVTPKGEFLGLPVNGRQVEFCENVIYSFRGGKIQEVWSIIDKAAIETQLP